MHTHTRTHAHTHTRTPSLTECVKKYALSVKVNRGYVVPFLMVNGSDLLSDISLSLQLRPAMIAFVWFEGREYICSLGIYYVELVGLFFQV